ncbi:MAG: hypothetical protein ABIQ11_05795, partial [Saprospiraceae bacterium]
HAYKIYSSEKCPVMFEFPQYAEIKEKDEPCWFDILMPSFKARIHCSYIKVKDRNDFDDLVRDAYMIADRINERANYMVEDRLVNTNGVSGLALTWTGPAASPYHFFLTDTTEHFFKAALYFDTKVQPDSLEPIVKFIKADIDQMIATFDWKE